MKSIENLIILPLRTNSKRIKDKNIRLINGRPLFLYQLDIAIKLDKEKLIVVVSENEKYFKYVKDQSVQKLLRDTAIAGALNKVEETVNFVINYYKKKNTYFDNVILLQATSPTNKLKYLVEGIDLINTGEYNSIITYIDWKRFRLSDKIIFDRPMTQKMKNKKIETGCFWIFKLREFLKYNNRIINPIGTIKVDYWDGLIDIDEEIDLEIAEYLLRKRSIKYFDKRKVAKLDEYYCEPEKIDPDGYIRNLKGKEYKSHRVDFFKDEISYINTIIKENPKKNKFLDIGCGTGAVASAISKKYVKYGLEVTKSVESEAKKYFDYLYIGIFNDSVYKNSFFDVIFSGHVLEHTEDPVDHITQIKRVLKPHGDLIISCPNYDSGVARRFGKNYRMYHDPTHITFFGDHSLKEFLNDYGFFVYKIEFPYFDTKYFNYDNLKRLFDVEKVSPPFYGNIMTMYCKKK